MPKNFEAYSDEFRRILGPSPELKLLSSELKFAEGVCWVERSGFLIVSDFLNDRIVKWSERDGLSIFRQPAATANGNTVDLEGRVVSCLTRGRSVVRQEHDGYLTTIADRYGKGRLTSPNDVVVKSDGTIWFTDPDYGIKPDQKEQPGNYVYHFDPKSQKLTVVAKDFDKPNGICFSPDEKKLYVADSGKPKHIRVFDAQADGTLSNGRVYVTIDKGAPDGIRCDANGRIWTSSGHGAQVFAPDGKLIVTINLPESAANLCFGGKDGKTLFLTARKSLYSVPTLVTGTRRAGS